MARPQALQFLKHGKLLCGSAFRLFVETWNWLVGYVNNIKGDYDVNPKNGFIVVDRSDPDSPVIRFRTDNLPAAGGGGSATPDDVSIDERDADDDTDDGALQIKDWDHATPPAASTTIAEDMVASSTPTDTAVTRKSDKSLVYKPMGTISCGSDSNIVFTATAGVGFAIDVYYA